MVSIAQAGIHCRHIIFSNSLTQRNNEFDEFKHEFNLAQADKCFSTLPDTCAPSTFSTGKQSQSRFGEKEVPLPLI